MPTSSVIRTLPSPTLVCDCAVGPRAILPSMWASLLDLSDLVRAPHRSMRTGQLLVVTWALYMTSRLVGVASPCVVDGRLTGLSRPTLLGRLVVSSRSVRSTDSCVNISAVERHWFSHEVSSIFRRRQFPLGGLVGRVPPLLERGGDPTRGGVSPFIKPTGFGVKTPDDFLFANRGLIQALFSREISRYSSYMLGPRRLAPEKFVPVKRRSPWEVTQPQG